MSVSYTCGRSAHGTDRWPVFFQSFTGSALAALVKGLPEALQRQYEYEDPIVRGGKQLLHSPFFKVYMQLFS